MRSGNLFYKTVNINCNKAKVNFIKNQLIRCTSNLGHRLQKRHFEKNAFEDSISVSLHNGFLDFKFSGNILKWG